MDSGLGIAVEGEGDGMSEQRLTILRELAAYELGVGWPYKPREEMDCPKGRALVGADDRRST